jgi:hypothetical protein
VEPTQVEPGGLNLLVGEFEPAACRSGRRRATLVAATVIVLSGLAVAIGQGRRAEALRREARGLEAAKLGVYERVLPVSTGSLPPAARLTAELRSLERTRAAAPGEMAPSSVIPSLSAVLASWPPELHITTESIVASPDVITLAARLPDEPAAERLERELRAPPGWSLSQPNVQRERDGIGVRLRMEGGGT